MAARAPLNGSGTTNIGAGTSPVPATGPGVWRVRLYNSGPVSVRVGDDTTDFDNGYTLRPGGELELLTDDIVYTCGPPNAAGIGQAQLDYISETR